MIDMPNSTPKTPKQNYAFGYLRNPGSEPCATPRLEKQTNCRKTKVWEDCLTLEVMVNKRYLRLLCSYLSGF